MFRRLIEKSYPEEPGLSFVYNFEEPVLTRQERKELRRLVRELKRNRRQIILPPENEENDS